MKKIKKHTIESLFNNQTEIVTWDQSYITGIELFDSQQREIFNITNQLYNACLDGRDQAALVFKETMSHMVDYVRFHFSAEQEVMKKADYPDYNNHKLQHDLFIKDIITAANEFDCGKIFTPNSFVRTLKDWIHGHIAYYDQGYAVFLADQKSKGLYINTPPTMAELLYSPPEAGGSRGVSSVTKFM